MSAYLRPRSLSDAIDALSQNPGVRIVAGGTDVYPALGENVTRASLLDITGIAALRGVDLTGDGLHIGALASWSDVQRAALPPGYRALQQAGREVGAPQIQNCGTVVGNICNASPAADGTVALMALGAQVAITGPAGTRRIPLTEFVTGVRQVALARDEIVTALHLPPAPGRSAFLKLGARKYMVISIAMVAASVETDPAGHIARAAVTVGACSPVAQRQPMLEAALTGATRDDLTDIVRADLLTGLSPIDDVRAPSAYRDDVVPVLIRRTLAACLEG